MRRDSIFYKLFQQSPTLVFELLTDPPENAPAYRFDSVTVKEPRFESEIFVEQNSSRVTRANESGHNRIDHDHHGLSI
jgi:predicted transposase YdaD